MWTLILEKLRIGITNDSLGAKIATAKIPNAMDGKFYFERISSTLSISTNMSSITHMNKFVRGQIRKGTNSREDNTDS